MTNIKSIFTCAVNSATIIGSTTAAACLLSNPIGIQGACLYGMVRVPSHMLGKWVSAKLGITSDFERIKETLEQKPLFSNDYPIDWSLVKTMAKVVAVSALIIGLTTFTVPWQLAGLCGYGMSLKSAVCIVFVATAIDRTIKFLANKAFPPG